MFAGGSCTRASTSAIGEVVEGIDRARLALRDQRAEPGEARAGFAVVHDEVVLATERDEAKRALGAVVVERDAHVTHSAHA